MFKECEFISEPYEIFRSFGFKFSGRNQENEHCIFTMRLDIVRRAGANLFSPVLWEVNPMLGALMQSEMRIPDNIARATEEEALSAALAYINSRGCAKESGASQKPATKGE